MATSNKDGQILIEVCVVMALIITVAFAAISEISSHRDRSKKYHLTRETHSAQKTSH